MKISHSSLAAFRSDPTQSLLPMQVLGLFVGVVLPLVSAFVYPTYFYSMAKPWAETTRLLELPFVAFELVVYFWASRTGFDVASAVRQLPKDIKIAGSLFFVGVFFGSTVLSNNVLYSLTHSLITVVHVLFALAVAHLIRLRGFAGFQSFLTWLVVGLVPLTLLTAYKFSFPPALSELPFGEIRWPSSLPGFIHVRHFGSWTGAIAAGLAIQILYLDDREDFSWSHLFYFFAAALTIWSGTRGAIMAMILTFVTLAIVMRRFPSMRALGRAAIITGFSLCVAFWLLPDVREFYLFQWSDVESVEAATSTRAELWAQTFFKWLESPIFGWGSGSTFWEVHIGWMHTQPHNVVLQFLISWGLIGAAGAFWILLRGLRIAHRVLDSDLSVLPLLAVLNALLFQSLVEGMLHYPRFIMTIVVLLVVIVLQAENRSTDQA